MAVAGFGRRSAAPRAGPPAALGAAAAVAGGHGGAASSWGCLTVGRRGRGGRRPQERPWRRSRRSPVAAPVGAARRRSPAAGRRVPVGVLLGQAEPVAPGLLGSARGRRDPDRHAVVGTRPRVAGSARRWSAAFRGRGAAFGARPRRAACARSAPAAARGTGRRPTRAAGLGRPRAGSSPGRARRRRPLGAQLVTGAGRWPGGCCAGRGFADGCGPGRVRRRRTRRPPFGAVRAGLAGAGCAARPARPAPWAPAGRGARARAGSSSRFSRPLPSSSSPRPSGCRSDLAAVVPAAPPRRVAPCCHHSRVSSADLGVGRLVTGVRVSFWCTRLRPRRRRPARRPLQSSPG